MKSSVIKAIIFAAIIAAAIPFTAIEFFGFTPDMLASIAYIFSAIAAIIFVAKRTATRLKKLADEDEERERQRLLAEEEALRKKLKVTQAQASQLVQPKDKQK
jgi:hypothetical protein